MKKIVALILAAVMLTALAGTAAAKTTAFSDVSDSGLARDVAVLQMLGVVSGDDNGNFMPYGTLTRAQFCKMAVMAMGKGEQAALYKNRTIFPDVRAGHWARGYINYAVSGEKKLIIGNSDGTFTPDSPISVAQAVTILLRMLGYTDADAGMLWPDGYLALAGETGLSEGVSLAAPASSLTRGDAARLFVNLLGLDKKDGALFAAGLGTTVSNAVIMELDVTASGTTGGVRVASGTTTSIFKTADDVLPVGILGIRGTLILNSANKILTIIPDANRQVTITAGTVSAAGIKDVSGTKYDIAADTPAYTASKVTSYGSAFIDIAQGMAVTLYLNTNGAVDGVYINNAMTGKALVAGVDGASVGSLTGNDTSYKIYKNGVSASSSDIQKYDVMTYDKAAKILYVSDFRLTGYYESCWPNMQNPSKITLMGHDFTVLPSAMESLSKYKVGQVITLLFTNNLQVAGAETNIAAGSTAVGIVQPGISSSSATVKLLNGLVVSGDMNISSYQAAQLNGELVSVVSVAAGEISLTKLYASGATGTLDLKNLTLGSAALSPAVRIFERVGTGPVTQIALSDLTQTSIPAAKIRYAGVDTTGRVNTLVLNDVTGDRYTYGILSSSNDGENTTVSVINKDNLSGTAPVPTGEVFSTGAIGGFSASADGQTATFIQLTQVKNVVRSSFFTVNDTAYVRINGLEYPVASNVQCYNSLGKTWFASLDDARAFSETLTVYYDRAPSDGGKIRVVVAG